MKPLDLKLVNRLAPYKVEYKRGEYVFETDHDIRYSIWFEQDPVSTTMPAYWFNLTNRSQKAGQQAEYYTRTEMVKDGMEKNYIAIILKRSHPHFQEVIDIFDKQIAMFRANKP